MNFDELVKFHSRAMSEEAIEDEEFVEVLDDIAEYLNERTKEGQKLILSKMNEQTLVKAIRSVKASILISMEKEGQGGFLAMSDLCNELEPYTHTVILAAVGMLIEKEVL